MPEAPFNFDPKNLKDAIRQMQILQDDLYQNRLAGAQAGGVFSIDNTSDTLKLTTGGGLSQTNNALAVQTSPSGAVAVTSTGLDVYMVSTTRAGVVRQLPNDVTKFLNGKGLWTVPGAEQWPIGAIFFGAVATDPATLLGFGTWTALANGNILIGATPVSVWAWQRTA